MEQFRPMSLINHWLSDSAFAQTYARWQNNGNPLGDDARSILQMLGHLPATELGIGLMRIATDAQRTAVIGADGSQWNTSVIVQEQLFSARLAHRLITDFWRRLWLIPNTSRPMP